MFSRLTLTSVIVGSPGFFGGIVRVRPPIAWNPRNYDSGIKGIDFEEAKGMKLHPMPVFTTVAVIISIASPAGVSSGSETTSGLARPSVSDLKLAPDRFRVQAPSGPHHKLTGGTRVSFTLSVAGTVRLGVVMHPPTVCGKPVTGARSSATCLIYDSGVWTFATVEGKPGTNSVFFSGKIRQRLLAPGKHKLDAFVNGGRKAQAEFTILGPPVHRPRN